MSVNVLEKIPEEIKDDAKKVWNALYEARKNGKAGLNMSQLRKITGLSYAAVTKVLSAMETAEIIQMEKVGTSKLYSIKEV